MDDQHWGIGGGRDMMDYLGWGIGIILLCKLMIFLLSKQKRFVLRTKTRSALQNGNNFVAKEQICVLPRRI